MLKGKNAIVTGSNRGIGKAIVSAYAENGANVWACVRKKDEEFSRYIADLAETTGSWIKPVYFDLGNTGEIKAAAKEISSDKLPIDILVNNAGAITTAPFLMTSLDKMHEMFELNYFSYMQFSQLVARQMLRKKQGSIINLSSSAAIEGNEGRAAYAGAKAAVITSTKVMARELGVAGIRVNAIAPGLTQTDMMTGSTPEDALATTIERIAMRRVGEPSEIAGAALFLASDLSSYVTGQTLSVDGGM
jgi:3-oxoacyl-[acyl-carrier protein] reductase